MTQLTISSLIAELTKVQAEHGDLPVVVRDADTTQPFKLVLPDVYVNDTSYTRKVLEFIAGYDNDVETWR